MTSVSGMVESIRRFKSNPAEHNFFILNKIFARQWVNEDFMRFYHENFSKKEGKGRLEFFELVQADPVSESSSALEPEPAPQEVSSLLTESARTKWVDILKRQGVQSIELILEEGLKIKNEYDTALSYVDELKEDADQLKQVFLEKLHFLLEKVFEEEEIKEYLKSSCPPLDSVNEKLYALAERHREKIRAFIRSNELFCILKTIKSLKQPASLDLDHHVCESLYQALFVGEAGVFNRVKQLKEKITGFKTMVGGCSSSHVAVYLEHNNNALLKLSELLKSVEEVSKSAFDESRGVCKKEARDSPPACSPSPPAGGSWRETKEPTTIVADYGCYEGRLSEYRKIQLDTEESLRISLSRFVIEVKPCLDKVVASDEAYSPPAGGRPLFQRDGAVALGTATGSVQSGGQRASEHEGGKDCCLFSLCGETSELDEGSSSQAEGSRFQEMLR